MYDDKKMNQSLKTGPEKKGNSDNGVKSNGPIADGLKRQSAMTSYGKKSY